MIDSQGHVESGRSARSACDQIGRVAGSEERQFSAELLVESIETIDKRACRNTLSVI